MPQRDRGPSSVSCSSNIGSMRNGSGVGASDVAVAGDPNCDAVPADRNGRVSNAAGAGSGSLVSAWWRAQHQTARHTMRAATVGWNSKRAGSGSSQFRPDLTGRQMRVAVECREGGWGGIGGRGGAGG